VLSLVSEVSKVSMVSKLRRLKVSKPVLNKKVEIKVKLFIKKLRYRVWKPTVLPPFSTWIPENLLSR
jgi:hypothetical protein